ncbi:phytanoyl-CoA dioxygenase family protein [Rhodovibrionaceae bacterium A322]
MSSPASPICETDLHQPAFWRDLNPQLSLRDSPVSIPARSFSAELLGQVSDQLAEEGYLFLPPLLSTTEIAPLRKGIETLVANDLPAAFAYLYDDYWQVFASFRPLLSRFLGEDFRLLPNFWAWHVSPGENNSGWPPHRDYQGESKVDDYLISLSLWLPLTEATPENGCMYVLPLSREAHYDKPVEETADIDLQDIRALPAQPGSLLGWRQDLFHWGARSSNRAKAPRLSLSLEFQNAAFDPLATPLLDAGQPPKFEERLSLILGQFEKYRHMEQLTDRQQQTLASLLS